MSNGRGGTGGDCDRDGDGVKSGCSVGRIVCLVNAWCTGGDGDLDCCCLGLWWLCINCW